jgi:hypothetical protein
MPSIAKPPSDQLLRHCNRLTASLRFSHVLRLVSDPIRFRDSSCIGGLDIPSTGFWLKTTAFLPQFTALGRVIGGQWPLLLALSALEHNALSDGFAGSIHASPKTCGLKKRMKS